MQKASHLSIVENDDENINTQSTNEGGRLSEGNRLISFADDFASAIRSKDSQHFLTFLEAPHLAVALEGASSPAMQEIALRYMAINSKWASGTAKTLAADFFNAQCLRAPAVEVSLRTACVEEVVYLDTCWSSNQVISVSATGVKVQETCQAVFVRNGVSAPLPEWSDSALPLTALLKYVRIPASALPALVACLINAMLTELPQPLMLIQGPAGTGKTTALRLLLDLIDPTTSLAGGSLTDDERNLRALSKVRRVLVFDNVSYVKGDASDLLAKITTGSELITRALYQNSTPDVVQLKRPVILNGIIDGFSRSDLASRTVAFNLQPVLRGERISEPELLSGWKAELPRIFRGLLDMTSHVLAELPTAPAPDTTFRNMELVKITSIVSKKLGIEGLAHLDSSVAELSASVLGASAMGQAFTSLVQCWKEEKCIHDAYGENSLAETFGKPLQIDTLREALLRHIDVSEHKSIPALNKAFGEALKRIESDLNSVLGLRLNKNRVTANVNYSLEVR